MTPSSLFCAKCGALASTIAAGVIRKHGECDGQPAVDLDRWEASARAEGLRQNAATQARIGALRVENAYRTGALS